MKKLVMGLTLLALGSAGALTLPQQVAEPLLAAGWWAVPCEDVFALPNADLSEVRRFEELGYAACVRNHNFDADALRAAFNAVAPDAVWQEFPGMFLNGETTIDGERLMLLAVPLSGAAMIALGDIPGAS